MNFVPEGGTAGGATASEFQEALKDRLQQRGTLDRVRSTLRADILTVLREPAPPPAPQNPDQILINELIREYLEFNYRESLSVFDAETGATSTPALPKAFLSQQLNLAPDANIHRLPLLYSLVRQSRELGR